MRFLLLFCFLIGLSPLRAQQSDSIQLSLLTCAPGQEIYELFGHTAIRYQNFTRGEDYVFNYGMFSFRTPNFVLRFVKGETDYQLGVTPYIYFESEYAMRGSSVYQQVLNLTEAEKQRLYDLLREIICLKTGYIAIIIFMIIVRRVRVIRLRKQYPGLSYIRKMFLPFLSDRLFINTRMVLHGMSLVLICAWGAKRMLRSVSVSRCLLRFI